MNKGKNIQLRAMCPETWRKIKIQALWESITIPELIKKMAEEYLSSKEKEKQHEDRVYP